MNTTYVATFNPVVMSLGLALVNFLWQGVMIGIVAAALLQLLGNARPQVRYLISCVALTLCIGLPLQATLNLSTNSSPANVLIESFGDLNTNRFVTTNLFPLWNWIQAHLLELVAAWAVCVMLFSVRLIIGLTWVARIAHPNSSSSNPHWQSRLDNLARRAGMQRKITLREVQKLESPAVVGWLRPIVLVPTSLIIGMPPNLMEALLAHEVAHIRRMDYIVNLIQNAVEILLFYHPAVWWISKQIRIEREQIADELAAQMTGEPRCLALALRELERVQFATSQLSVPANGGNLLNRIKRLTRPAVNPIEYKVVAPAICLIFAGIAFYANAASDTTAPVAKENLIKATVDFDSCEKPEYPKQSLDNKEQGTVRTSYLIDLKGHVISSKIDRTSGHSELDNAALNALSKCTFHPGIQNGKPVISRTIIDYVWVLPE